MARPALLLALLFSSCSSALQTREIQGVLVHTDGRPGAAGVVGTTVGLGWDPPSGAVEIRLEAEAGPDGRFSGRARLSAGENVLFAASGDRARGAYLVVGADAPTEGLSIRLDPLVEVRGKFDAGRLDPFARKPPLNVVDCRLLDETGRRVADWSMRQATFVLRIPPGKYTLVAAGTFSQVEKTFTLAAGKRSVDLGTIGLDPTYLERLAGKEPPAWNVTEARGARPGVQAIDFRGKWLLVEFWSHEKAACVRQRLPELVRFCEKHEAERNGSEKGGLTFPGFEIIAIHHSPGVRSFVDLEEKFRSETGREVPTFPFPMLLDATPKTFVSSEINHLPAAILVDPAGRIEGLGHVGRLEHKLKLPWPLPR